MVKAKAKVVQEFDPIDILKVIKRKKGFAYRWVKKSNLEMKRVHGWEPVIRTSEEIQRSADFGLGSGKVIERGDLILCEMPQAQCNRLKAAKAQRARRQMDSIKRTGLRKHSTQEGQKTGKQSLETLSELGIGDQDEALAERTVTAPVGVEED